MSNSSTKILSFLVNDILDFAQISAGKFRSITHNFNVKEAIEEVVVIQQEKANFNKIKIEVEFENFE